MMVDVSLQRGRAGSAPTTQGGDPSGPAMTGRVAEALRRPLSDALMVAVPLLAMLGAVAATQQSAGPLLAAAGIAAVVLSGAVAVARDRARRSRDACAAAEARLAESERRFQLVAENATDLICLVSEDGVCAYASPACERLLDWPPDAVAGRPITALVVPEDADRLRALLDPGRLAQAATALVLARCGSGGAVWAEVTSRPADGEDKGWVLIWREVTSRKLLQDALTEQLCLHEVLLDTIPTPIYFKNTQGHYLGCNQAFAAAVGIARNDLIGRTVFDIVPPELAARHHQADQCLLAEGGTQTYEGDLHRGDGAAQGMIFSKAVWRGSDGRPEGIVGVATDISERKRVEAALQAAKLEAEEASRSKTEFLAMMAHELRSPLQAIVMVTEALIRDASAMPARALRDGLQDALHDILESARHLTGLVADNLDIARIQAGQHRLTEARVALAEVVTGAVRMVRHRAMDKRIDLTVDTAGAPTLQADGAALRQVAINLLTNAIKFTSPGGSITIVAGCAPNGEPQLRVHDTGIGIPADDLARVTEPFVQAGNAAAGDEKGSGLGLAITRRLVDLHGGDLTIDSAVGEGTTVTVRLPRDRIAEPPPTAVAPPAIKDPAARPPAGGAACDPKPATGSRLIVLIDDNATLRATLTRIIRALGHHPVSARSTAEAVAALTATGVLPDLIIADYTLDGTETGTEAIAALRRYFGAGIPALMLTGDTSAERHREASDQGFRVLHKPVDLRLLERLIAVPE